MSLPRDADHTVSGAWPPASQPPGSGSIHESDDASGEISCPTASWPDRARALLRACGEVPRYVAGRAPHSPQVAWAVGCAGLLSAALLLLARRAKLAWAGRRPKRDDTPAVSTYDSVTGLPTQRLFMTLLNQAVARAKKAGRQIAVAVVELDHFTVGEESHEQIDRTMIYRIQAARLKSTLHTTDTVARLGERSFAALFLSVADVADVSAVALKMHTALSMPVVLQGREMFLTSRIGVAMSVGDTSDAEGLLSQAAEALAQAGKDGYALYGSVADQIAPARDVLSQST